MSSDKHPMLTPQAKILQRVSVRPILPDERKRWDRLMRTHHYLGLRVLAGKSLRYVALFDGRWLALLGWQAAALKCSARDQWIGWPTVLQYQRLHLIANNARFLILPGPRISNLASRILALNLKRLSSDWQGLYGHPIVLAETFVDRARFSGTCYHAANWQLLGQTRGYAKTSTGYAKHHQPKDILVYPLHAKACHWLRQLHPHRMWRTPMQAVTLTARELETLHQQLRALPDHRTPAGLRHPFATVLTIGIAAVLAGSESYAAIAEFAQRLTQHQLKRLRARFDRTLKRFLPPSEPTLRRVFQAANAEAIDTVLGTWLMDAAPVEAIAIDGKTLKGARDSEGAQVHLLSAFLQGQGVTIAQRNVGKKTNEIPELRKMLEPMDITGRVITADALHTQHETARYITEEKQADYFFIVKKNQPTLLDNLQTLRDEDFPPGT